MKIVQQVIIDYSPIGRLKSPEYIVSRQGVTQCDIYRRETYKKKLRKSIYTIVSSGGFVTQYTPTFSNGWLYIVKESIMLSDSEFGCRHSIPYPKELTVNMIPSNHFKGCTLYCLSSKTENFKWVLESSNILIFKVNNQHISGVQQCQSDY